MPQLTRRELLQGVCALPLGSAPAGSTQAAQSPALSTPAPAASRERILMDFDWRFHFGHATDLSRDFDFGRHQRTFAKAGDKTATAAQLQFDDRDWRQLHLPHDWAVELPFAASEAAAQVGDDMSAAAHGYKALGRDFPETSIGWYRRSFDVPASDLGRRISIEFDGVFRDCVVFCNGHIVGRNESGYAPFSVDLSDFLEYGASNVVTVRVDATTGEGWFYEGAGIYRHVWLVKTAALHVPKWGVFVRPEFTGSRAQLHISTEIVNEGATPRQCRVRSRIVGLDDGVIGEVISDVIGLEAGASTIMAQTYALLRPKLWSPSAPHLYRLETRVEESNQVVDGVDTAFGVRAIEFHAQRGFILNGEPVKLKGTCNHQDHAGVGTAVPDRLLEWRIERLQEMGCNAYRIAHHPPAAELLDICDRLGMLLIDETRVMSSDDEALSQLSRLVRRDRNHPCVILWSLGNEEPQQASARGARIARTMKRLLHRLDPSRPCIYAMDQGFGEGVSQVVDVLGFNYRTDQMEAFHQRFPQLPILGSETGSTVCTRGIYRRDDAKGYVPAYDTDHPWWATTAESWWMYVASRAYIAGGFVWTGFDYRGEPTPFNRWPSISSHFGVMDTCGFPKDNYHYYRAQWRDEPVLHLFPHWNWQPGETIEVWCHTNLDAVELFLNGRSLGRCAVPRYGHAAWTVTFVPGVLTARGYRDGKLIQTARRETTGTAARVVLKPDRVSLRADGRDLSVIEVQIVDQRGRVVPTGDHEVTFEVSGPGVLIGVGNGNPISLEPDKSDRRRAFNGRCLALVQTTRSPGEIVAEANSVSLKTARTRLIAR